MPYSIYVLRSEEGFIYVGMTADLERRLQEHNSGQSHSTKKGQGWKMIYKEECTTAKEARKREKYLKSHAGKEWLKRRNIL